MTMTRSLLHRTGFGIAALAVALATPAQAQAQPDASPQWAPWTGCWQIADESVSDKDAAMMAILGLQAAPRTHTANDARVCIAPAADIAGAATMTTHAGGQVVLTETIVPDGSQRILAEPECRGWQRAEWSDRAARLYTRAEISCKDQPTRTVSSLAMLTAGPLWIDVQLIESEGRKNLRVRRYQRADVANPRQPSLQRAAAAPLSSRLSIADVTEINGKVPAEVLQALILELKAPFDLNGERLVALHDADVPPSVVDLMVALTFPKRFVIERSSSGSSGWRSGGAGFGDYWGWYADPFFYTSYYSPFTYRYWGWYDPYYYGGPGFVTIVNPAPGEPMPSGEGRVVDGRGYTRVTTRRPDPVYVDGGTGGWGTSSAGSNGSSGSSGGSSGVSSGGYSGGGGGGERTAVPRPPGGN